MCVFFYLYPILFSSSSFDLSQRCQEDHYQSTAASQDSKSSNLIMNIKEIERGEKKKKRKKEDDEDEMTLKITMMMIIQKYTSHSHHHDDY